MSSRIFDIDYINAKIYYYEHLDHYRKLVREYRKKRMKIDPQFKLICNMRTRLNIAFKSRNWEKNSRTADLLGCSLEKAIIYIQGKFKEGMTWENYGKWHIDHIIPLSSAKTFEEIIKLCHFTNLQPLWALDNIRKRGKTKISI